MMFDGTTGRTLHTTAGSLSWTGATTLFGPPLVDEQAGRFFLLDRDRGLLGVYDTRSGALVRTVTVGLGTQWGGMNASHGSYGPEDLHLDAAHGRIWQLNSLDSKIRVLDARNGSLLRTIDITNMYPPWDAAALVIATRHNLAFIALPVLHPSAADGLWFYGLATIQQSPSAQDLIFDGDTRISVRNATTGSVESTVAGGAGPCSMAVDEPASKVLVACDGGKEYVGAQWQWVPSWVHHWLPLLPAPAPATTRAVPASLAVLDEARL